jgi:hypothetical protein
MRVVPRHFMKSHHTAQTHLALRLQVSSCAYQQLHDFYMFIMHSPVERRLPILKCRIAIVN